MAWLFGSSKRALRQRVARQHNGTLCQAGDGATFIVSPRGKWNLVFDFDTPEGPAPIPLFGQRQATRIGVPFTPRSEFAWTLRRRPIVGDAVARQRRKLEREGADALEEFVRKLQSELKPPSVLMGYGDFDYEFNIETNDEDRLRDLFADPDLRRSLQDLPSISFKATQDDEWFYWVFEEQTDNLAILYCQLAGTVDNDALLEDIADLLEAIMVRLAAMGIAEPTRPGLFLGTGM